MSNYKSLLCLALGAGLLAGCYEDKGNYEYRTDIHDISVKLKGLHEVHKKHEKMSYTLTPEVTTVDGDKSKLEYLWLWLKPSGVMDTLSVEETATLEIDPQSPDFAERYNLRFYVTDTRTKGVTMAPTRVELIKPYSYAWLVLHEDNGHAELGTVEYLTEETKVTPRAYTDEQGTSLTGKPIGLTVAKNAVEPTQWGVSTVSQVFVTTTNLAESGLMDQSNRFKLVSPWNKLVHPDQAAEIDFTKMRSAGADEGLLVCSQGKVFRNSTTSPVMYRMNPATGFTDPYAISHVINNFNLFSLGYDSIGHRFVGLFYGFRKWYGTNITTVRDAGTISTVPNKAENAADPGNIPADHHIIRMLNGYRYSTANPTPNYRYAVYAYALGSGGKSHVYVLHYLGASNANATYGPSLPGRYTFNTPAGLTESTPMTTSPDYNNILFYAHGNKVYRLDFSTGVSSVIYTHEAADAQVVSLKMAVDGYVEDKLKFGGSATYGHPYSRCLGVGVNTADGKGEVVVLQLNTAGKVDEDKKHPSTQVYKGFGKITQVCFI